MVSYYILYVFSIDREHTSSGSLLRTYTRYNEINFEAYYTITTLKTNIKNIRIDD